jgi:glycosyltransferase involved in cell wall biosynthesis
MKFAIITHVPHIHKQNQYFAYAPYVNEMNIWANYIDELIIVAPLQKSEITAIDSSYNSKRIQFVSISAISLLGLKAVLNTIFKAPKISWQIFNAMREADHIHLRCPGNIGLLGCLVQILFPSKLKTAKYAGNWDPKARQPWSYRLQKWILSNTFLTRNMQVLVYGEWEGSTKNIIPFFTATYSEAEKTPIKKIDLKGTINFVFVGTLSLGKNPLYAIQLVEKLYEKGHKVSLDLYGEGTERRILENYIASNGLEKYIVLRGNQNQKAITEAYQNSHFVILPSKSEGWPKVVAEGMFWGCVPLATKVSCVPFMLADGIRGILLQQKEQHDIIEIMDVLNNESLYHDMAIKSANWSRQFTTDIFENGIKDMIVH